MAGLGGGGEASVDQPEQLLDGRRQDAGHQMTEPLGMAAQGREAAAMAFRQGAVDPLGASTFLHFGRTIQRPAAMMQVAR